MELLDRKRRGERLFELRRLPRLTFPRRRVLAVFLLVLLPLSVVVWWRVGLRTQRARLRPDWAGDRLPNVRFQSDGRSLKGWVYGPADEKIDDRRPAVIWNHGSEEEVWPSPALVETFRSHGFVVFIPVRRYHGPSTRGDTIMKLIHGASNRARAWIDLNQEENRDVLHARDWLREQPYVDPERLVVAGASFGGVQTLFAAEADSGFKAAIAFAPAAISWGDGKGEINARMEAAVRNRKIPLFLIQARNDFSLGPTDVLGPLLDNVELQHRVVQYPAFGTRTSGMTDEQWHYLGHGAFALEGGSVWGADVFAFIEAAFAR
jgi:dienelactone hydrolase